MRKQEFSTLLNDCVVKKLTLKDIAAHFEVSISTISKALNDSHEISEGLKERIRDYARDNHYKPNQLARSLLKKSTGNIGVVVPNILNYFFTQVFYGIEQTANKRGYNLISCISDESFEKEVRTVEFLSSGTVDGLIISLSEETQAVGEVSHLKEFLENEIPLVMFDRVSHEIECDKVVVDDFEAGYKSTQYLINSGRSRIALVSPISHSSVGQLRLDGYRKALKEANIEFNDHHVVNLHKEDDLELLLTLLLDNNQIDALIALDEMTAIRCLKYLKGKKYNIPQDIALLGFTNGIISRHVSPALTMVSQHGQYIGKMAAEILIERIEKKNGPIPFTTKLIKTSLIEREST